MIGTRREAYVVRFDCFFLVWIILYRKGLTSACEACISPEDKLYPWNVLFHCQITRIAERFVDWINCSFEFWCDIDWHFSFDHSVEWVKFFSHPGHIIFVKNPESETELCCFYRFGDSEVVKKVLNFPSLRWVKSQTAGRLKTPCIKIGYSEPRGAKKREGSFTVAGSCRVFLDDVILDSDWLTTITVFRAWFWLAADKFLVLDKIRVCLVMYYVKV